MPEYANENNFKLAVCSYYYLCIWEWSILSLASEPNTSGRDVIEIKKETSEGETKERDTSESLGFLEKKKLNHWESNFPGNPRDSI